MSATPIQGQLATKRLISLDALRGFTIAGMVIVNSPGSWTEMFAPLQHAEWNGWTATDLIFPFFLFMVGVSIAFAYTKRLEAKVPKKDIYKKIISRTLKIYGLGIFLWLWAFFDFSTIRWVGVLPRISFVFFACALIFLNTNWKQQVIIGTSILIGYWILIAYIPVPGIGTPDLSAPGMNWANYLDNLLVPGRLWKETWDPEGLLSTFPAIVTGIIGMLAGRIIIHVKEQNRKLVYLYFAGFMMFLAGMVWNWFFPINKNIWTSSFVLLTGGLAMLSLASLIIIVDVWGYKSWTKLGLVYGANAITSYVLAGMLKLFFYRDVLWSPSWNKAFMDLTTSMGIQGAFASLLYSIIYMLIIFIPAYILYKKKIFIKV